MVNRDWEEYQHEGEEAFEGWEEELRKERLGIGEDVVECV